MLNANELNVFIEAARAQNFSVAARRLYLSQPAVSLHIRSLEKHLGVELFERNGRNITLSEAGKTLLPMTQELLLQMKHIEEVMWGLRGRAIGQLSIACSTTPGKYALPRLVAAFGRQYAEVRVKVTVMNCRASIDWLLEGRAEIGVMAACLAHHDLEYRPFAEDQIVLIVAAGHPWADGRAVTPADLLHIPFILREQTSGTYGAVAEGLTKHGIGIEELQACLTVTNAEAVTLSVEEGIGAAFVSRLAAARDLRAGRVKAVPVQDLQLTRTIYLVRHRRDAGTPIQQVFWDFAFAPAHEGLRRLFSA